MFCGVHTCLGFSGDMDKTVARIEADMKLEHVVKNFMVDIDMDSKQGSFAGRALDMCLRLIAPEYPGTLYDLLDDVFYDVLDDVLDVVLDVIIDDVL